MDWSTFDERFEWSMAIQNQDVFLGFQYKVEKARLGTKSRKSSAIGDKNSIINTE